MKFSNFIDKRKEESALNRVCKSGTIKTREEELAFLKATHTIQNFIEVITSGDMALFIEGLTEMAAPAIDVGAKELKYEIRKTPYLFNTEDINYLYQFPPRFWTKALSYRYNQMIYESHRIENDGHDIPDFGFITLHEGGKAVTFFVNHNASLHYHRLTANVNPEYFNKLQEFLDSAKAKGMSADDVLQQIRTMKKEYEKQHSYYGQTLGKFIKGGEVKEKADDREPDMSTIPNPIQRYEPSQKLMQRMIQKSKGGKDQTDPPDRVWIWRGLVGMSKGTASKNLGVWMQTLADGWLSDKTGSDARNDYNKAVKVDWNQILNVGGNVRPRAVMVPVWSQADIKNFNEIDNSLMDDGMSEVDEGHGPSYIFEGRHPEWHLPLKNKNYQAAVDLLAYEDTASSEVYQVQIPPNPEIVKKGGLPCRVWKGITRSGSIIKFASPLPMLNRGMMIENNTYRDFEEMMEVAETIKKANDTPKGEKLVEKILKGRAWTLQQIEDLAEKFSETEDARYQKMIEHLQGNLRIIDYLDKKFKNWGEFTPEEQKMPPEKAAKVRARRIMRLLASRMSGEESYADSLEKEAKLLVQNAVDNDLVQDEHEYVRGTYKKRGSMYHWILGGGAEMNKGTKQYLHADQEEAKRYMDEHEKYFAFSRTQHDPDEGREVPTVSHYAYLDPETERDLLQREENNQRRVWSDNKKKFDLLDPVIKAKIIIDPEQEGRVSLYDLIEKHEWLAPNLIINPESRQPLHKLTKKKKELSTLKARIEAFKKDHVTCAYDLVKEWVTTMGSLRKVEKRMKDLDREKKNGWAGWGPIGDGIWDFMERIEGTPEYDALLIGMNMLFQSIKMYIRRNLGEPSYTEFVEAEKEYLGIREKIVGWNTNRKPTDPEVPPQELFDQRDQIARKLYRAVRRWKNRIRTLAFMYTKCMWQLDLGFGTRRMREKDPRRKGKGLRPMKIKGPGDKNKPVELSPEDEELEEKIKKLFQIYDRDRLEKAMPTGFKVEDFIREMKSSLEGREEERDETTLSGIDAQRLWLYRMLRGVATPENNLREMMHTFQKPDSDGDRKENPVEDVDYMRAFESDDMLTAHFLKKGGRIRQLVQIGFIVNYQREHNGQSPTQKEVDDYMAEVMTRVLQPEFSSELYRERKLSDKAEYRNRYMRREDEAPRGHAVARAKQIVERPNMEQSDRALWYIYQTAQSKWEDYLKGGGFDPLVELDDFASLLRMIANSTHGPEADSRTIREILGKEILPGTMEEEMVVPVKDLLDIANWYTNLITRNVPHFREARNIITALKTKEAYAWSDQLTPAYREYHRARDKGKAARNWIQARACTSTGYVTIKGVLWRLSLKDQREIDYARAMYGERAEQLVGILRKKGWSNQDILQEIPEEEYVKRMAAKNQTPPNTPTPTGEPERKVS